MTVSIKFCGGCNPRIDRTRVAEELKNYLLICGADVVYNKFEADFIVFISGCSASCASRGAASGQTAYTVIAGMSIDSLTVAEDELTKLAIEKVRDYLGKLERPL